MIGSNLTNQVYDRYFDWSENKLENVETMKFLITGGCGFIGSNIAAYLKKINRKNKIYCADNFYRKGSIENKKRLLKISKN